ncbi:MAG TPA: DUF1800 domain-containing protein [Chitinophagaceae bacterium]|jgi:uncharacterized protein (DUF1800 family)|nr:DUF1800 domain-containing protein [Chitinophagaceae bacterium]
MNNNQLKNQHLWWRAGFGPPADQVELLSKEKPETLFHSILKASDKKPDFFDVADPVLKQKVMESQSAGPGKYLRLKQGDRQMFRKQSVQDIFKLNIRWIQEMTGSPAQLLEKMSLFWHGHFAAKTVNILYDQELLSVIRMHALGNFRDLLLNVGKTAAMIRFLNNNQNKKGHPNENFARELMELFTIGRGHYTETDIKESARAFTGWGANLQGDFNFRPGQHDEGIKSFFGKTGNLSGEDILEILLEQKQTAIFITRKIYRFFINENADEEKVNVLASRFYESGYDIRDLMIRIFTSSWFYDPENIGIQIKSPVLWMVGMRRQLPMELGNPALLLVLERLLGQVLFSPPNVAGWPGGKQWIDSSSLMLRMQVPGMIYRSQALVSHPKEDDDVMMGRSSHMPLFQTQIQWGDYIKNFNNTEEPAIYAAVSNLLLQKSPPLNEKDLIPYIDESTRERRIQSITIRLMSTPEYQLC